MVAGLVAPKGDSEVLYSASIYIYIYIRDGIVLLQFCIDQCS